MKRMTLRGFCGAFFLPVLFAAAFPARAEEPRPARTAEFGFDLSAGYASGLLALGDIFNASRALTLNFEKTTVDDFAAWIDAEAEAFINVNIGKLGFGLFAGVEASGQAKAENLLRFLREGNNRDRAFSGSARMGGGVFFEAGLSARFPLGRFRINVRPALYAPLFYAPPPSVSYRTRADGATGEISLEASLDMDFYSYTSLENGFPSDSLHLEDLSLGADLGAEALWLFLPALDLGAGISHIPIVPATMKHRTRFQTDYSWQVNGLFQELSNGTFSIPGAPDIQTSYDGASFLAFRPLRFSLFAVYRPLDGGGNPLFALRPLIGLSFLTPYGYDQVCFNFALEGQLNIFRIFSAALSTGLDERVWRHRLALMFNFHAVELRLAFTLQGTDFLGSWAGRGLGFSLGMSFGW